MHGAYRELKLAWELFGKAPAALSPPEREHLRTVALRQRALERRILASREAAAVIVSEHAIDGRQAEIRRRYASDAEFAGDLARSGLDAGRMRLALAHDLRIEAVLEKVAAEVPPVSAVDAELFYHSHPEAFVRAEARRLRHILLTYDGAGERARISAELAALRMRLHDAEAFAAAALRRSQCPTALHGGELGVVRRGQLYAELEPAAFALAAGEISAVLESPVGLHLLRCDEIFPTLRVPFAEAAADIAARLGERRRRERQRQWLQALPPAER
ncbi:MAG: nitrogen fixation protein NifM [Rhodocyclales bacterium]|nr:nitrogen fixation protein NifM [Rhodocyclales bacterium]